MTSKLITACRLAALCLLAGAAQAQVAINQAAALAGGVTAGDAPWFPVTLNTPGHYVLTGHLQAPHGTVAIHIQGPHITLNLNGFAVYGMLNCYADQSGVPVCPGGAPVPGILALQDGVVIRNGLVRGHGGQGIQMKGGVVEDVHVDGNAGGGISAGNSTTGAPLRISGVRVTTNTGTGIFSRNALIERTLVEGNEKGVVGMGMLIVDSMIKRNVSYGLYDTSNGPSHQPTAMKGTVMHGNGNLLGLGNTKSLGGNLIDGLPF